MSASRSEIRLPVEEQRARTEMALALISTVFTVLGVALQIIESPSGQSLWTAVVGTARAPGTLLAAMAVVAVACLMASVWHAYSSTKRPSGRRGERLIGLLLAVCAVALLVQNQSHWLAVLLLAASLVAWLSGLLPVTGSDLPAHDYARLVGRRAEKLRVLRALAKNRRVFLLTGMGGVGKTALAHEVALALQDRWRFWLPRFECIVWSSAKLRQAGIQGVTDTGLSTYDLDSLLDDIIRQAHCAADYDLATKEKTHQVRDDLRERRVLVVVDNLDTIADAHMDQDPAETVLTFCHQVVALLGERSRLLITSRYALPPEQAESLDLLGLDRRATRRLALSEARRLGVGNVSGATRQAFDDMHHQTGGLPLMIKLLVGIAQYQPLEAALSEISSVRSPRIADTYDYVFSRAWHHLSPISRDILVALTVFAPETGGEYDMARKLGDWPPCLFQQAIGELETMSLLSIVGRAQAGTWLHLHQITHTYVSQVLQHD